MRIAVIGDGAMGTLFGSLLSRRNEVYIVSISPERSALRNERGIAIGGETFHPVFTAEPSSLAEPDLVLIFVKSNDTESALRSSSCLLSGRAMLMTLQNGAGHESVMRKFVPEERIIIGKTEQNGSLIDDCTVSRGNPGGVTMLSENGKGFAEEFAACDLPCSVSDDIPRIVWRKILTNASLSAATGVFMSSIGFLGKSTHAFALVEKLLAEAVETAAADGYQFDYTAVRDEIYRQCQGGEGAYTSIEKDLENGRPTEAEFITGYVVRKADEHGIAAPVQRAVLEILHAAEDKNGFCR